MQKRLLPSTLPLTVRIMPYQWLQHRHLLAALDALPHHSCAPTEVTAEQRTQREERRVRAMGACKITLQSGHVSLHVLYCYWPLPRLLIQPKRESLPLLPPVLPIPISSPHSLYALSSGILHKHVLDTTPANGYDHVG
jgi:hypothetical protein